MSMTAILKTPLIITKAIFVTHITTRPKDCFLFGYIKKLQSRTLHRHMESRKINTLQLKQLDLGL